MFFTVQFSRSVALALKALCYINPFPHFSQPPFSLPSTLLLKLYLFSVNTLAAQPVKPKSIGLSSGLGLQSRPFREHHRQYHLKRTGRIHCVRHIGRHNQTLSRTHLVAHTADGQDSATVQHMNQRIAV